MALSVVCPHHESCVYAVGDGNCAYRAVMFSLIEGAHTAHQPVRKSMGKRLVALRKRLPSWAKHDNGVSSVKAGFKYLQVR